MIKNINNKIMKELLWLMANLYIGKNYPNQKSVSTRYTVVNKIIFNY